MARKGSYESNSSRRAKVRGVFVEHISRKKLFAQYAGRCGICGESLHPTRWTVDHIIPISRGGLHAYFNAQPAHAFCNRLKADLLPEEFELVKPAKLSRKSRKQSYRNVPWQKRRSKR